MNIKPPSISLVTDKHDQPNISYFLVLKPAEALQDYGCGVILRSK